MPDEPSGEDAGTARPESEIYEVLKPYDVNNEPSIARPIGPGDVFADVELAHLAEPFRGYVMVVGHPCSLRRGLSLQDDIPVAPLQEPGIPTAQHPHADRVLPVGKLTPPGAERNQVVQLTRTTTMASERLDVAARCTTLSTAGVVALQQRVVGNQTRVKVPAPVITAHCRGPLTELELWTDWRERASEVCGDVSSWDGDFDAFMQSASGFDDLSWRDALGVHEHARGRAVAAMEAALDVLETAHTQAPQ